MYLLHLALLASILIATAVSLSTDNSSNLTLHNSRSANKYHIISYDQKTWLGAWTACHMVGMELAAIHSKEDDNAVIDLIKDKGFVYWWTSGTDQDVEGSFVWTTNGRPVTYSNWHDGQPDQNNNDPCILYESRDGNYKWNDWTCNYVHNFICQNVTRNN